MLNVAGALSGAARDLGVQPLGQLRPAADPELGVDALQVVLDRPPRQVQPLGDVGGSWLPPTSPSGCTCRGGRSRTTCNASTPSSGSAAGRSWPSGWTPRSRAAPDRAPATLSIRY